MRLCKPDCPIGDEPRQNVDFDCSTLESGSKNLREYEKGYAASYIHKPLYQIE